jgi:hypothetical protein
MVGRVLVEIGLGGFKTISSMTLREIVDLEVVYTSMAN